MGPLGRLGGPVGRAAAAAAPVAAVVAVAQVLLAAPAPAATSRTLGAAAPGAAQQAASARPDVAPITGDWYTEPNSFHTLSHLAPTLAHELLDRPQSFVWDIPVSQGWHFTPYAAYGSYAAFADDLGSGRAPRATMVMYDPERCCGFGDGIADDGMPAAQPTPPEEQQHPTTYMPLFATLAHAHGYDVIVAPALDLLTVPGGDCTKAGNENLFAAYLRCGFARAAARDADAIDIQAQTYECAPATYAADVKAAAGQARSVNARVRIESGLTTGKCQPTADQLDAAYGAVASTVDGHFIALVEPDHQAGIDFLARLAPVIVGDLGLSPGDGTIGQGSTVSWRVSWNAHAHHSISDRSGMGLFDTGLQKPGFVFRFLFVGAGSYRVTDVATGHTGTVDLPTVASPSVGTPSTSFSIRAATADAPAGCVFQTQIQRPGSTEWSAWLDGPFHRFVPDSGTGTYRFRARLLRKSNGAASGWSPSAAITVAAG